MRNEDERGYPSGTALADLSTTSDELLAGEPRYAGLRMSADEYLATEDDGFRYEVVDGVVVMAASPDWGHQSVQSEIIYQLKAFVRTMPSGDVLGDINVRFSDALVYRPDIVFIRAGRVPRGTQQIRIIPDLIVEIISPTSVVYDLKTKRGDYERFGVTEYWIVDTRTRQLRLLRLEHGTYVETVAASGTYESVAAPGFRLDVGTVVEAMK